MAELNRVGMAAVAHVAAAQRLPVGDLRVVSARGNLLVHLAPAPVLARVATLTGWTRRDPAAWLAHEVSVARHAADHGGPVVAPTALAEPGPHLVNGLALSLWEYRETLPVRADGRELGVALAALHAAVADHPGPLPWLTPVTDQIADCLHALERDQVLAPEVLSVLRARHADVLAELDGTGSSPIVLHGDAHAGNLLRCADGWRWTDLEETCLGPPEWDLAVMVSSQDADGTAALAGWAAATGERVPSVAGLAPFGRARDLEALVWLLGMAHLYPRRYRTPAAERLAEILQRW